MTAITEAKRLYEACPVPKPLWEDLGDVTRSVWIERATCQLAATPVSEPVGSATAGTTNGDAGQFSLFT